jgi:hypothetical protein
MGVLTALTITTFFITFLILTCVFSLFRQTPAPVIVKAGSDRPGKTDQALGRNGLMFTYPSSFVNLFSTG